MHELNDAHPTVFISYSHDDKDHESKVLELSDRLRTDGVNSFIDQYIMSPPEGWAAWSSRKIEEAHFVLVVCTRIYCDRFSGMEHKEAGDGTGLGAGWEGSIISQQIYESRGKNTKFIPVVLSSGAAWIPTPLRNVTHYDLTTKDGYDSLYRRLTNQPVVSMATIGELKPMPPVQPLEAYGGASRPDTVEDDSTSISRGKWPPAMTITIAAAAVLIGIFGLIAYILINPPPRDPDPRNTNTEKTSAPAPTNGNTINSLVPNFTPPPSNNALNGQPQMSNQATPGVNNNNNIQQPIAVGPTPLRFVLSSRVYHGETPIKGAKVTLIDTPEQNAVETDSTGSFLFEGVNKKLNEKVEIRVESRGFKTRGIPVVIGRNIPYIYLEKIE